MTSDDARLPGIAMASVCYYTQRIEDTYFQENANILQRNCPSPAQLFPYTSITNFGW